MTRPLLVVACTLYGVALAAQSTLFVTPSGTGDGGSWATAADLHTALKRATPGTAVWLAAGTYLTSASDNRELAFRIPTGVQVIGGFSGSETKQEQGSTNPAATVLSGAIGGADPHDNAYTVVRITGGDGGTILENLTVSGAYANGSGVVADPKRAGGGLLIDLAGPGTKASPTIRNVVFEHNYARDGGAVYVDGSGGQASPAFERCVFRRNEADLDGGAVYNDGRRYGEASPTFKACLFEANEANYGAAVFNQATKGTASPRMSECTFRQNRAYVRGTTLYNIDHQGTSRSVTMDCVFDETPPEAHSLDDLARAN